MAESPRRSRRLRGESPEVVVSLADLLRRARRARGDPPQDVPAHYEGLKLLVTPPRDSREGPSEEGESSLVVHSDYQNLATGYDPETVEVSELTGSVTSTGDIGEEPQISEPVTPTSSVPGSPRVERVITENLPSGLLSIEELSPEEDLGVSSVEDEIITLDLRERESIFYSPPRSTTWYLSLTNYLDNSVSFSPPRFPFPPGGFTPPVYMSSPSSPEAYLYSGPSVPAGYQSISGTFSGASPRTFDQKLLAGSSGNSQLSAEEILMMSGQPQGSQLPPGGQPQGTSYLPRGQPQGTSYLPGGQPQGTQFAPGG